MANTEFYDRAYTDSSKISWKDIFSEFRRKHTKQDMEYALLAGTSLDTATEATMLRKWRKPWLFYPLFLGGTVLIAVISLIIYIQIRIFGVSMLPALNLIFIMVPPLIFPLVLMVFFWELNIPRNISIYRMLGYFLIGGMVSILATLIVISAEPVRWTGLAPLAPFSEEPGKLAAALIFLAIFAADKKHKVYGITGLVIGAAVGAGFAGFESAQYAYSAGRFSEIGGLYIISDIFGDILKNELIRGIYSLGGHTLFCAPYMAAVALHMKENKLNRECFLNKDFVLTFGCSFLMHLIWNWDLGVWQIKCIFVIAVLWFNALYIARKCFRQVVEAGRNHAGDEGIKAESVAVQCIQGPLKGAVWQAGGGESLLIGRSPLCEIRIPANASGISRQHCSIGQSASGWTIRDLNSAYGTFVNDEKLVPGMEYTLRSGEIFYLGGRGCAFRVDIR